MGKDHTVLFLFDLREYYVKFLKKKYYVKRGLSFADFAVIIGLDYD